MYRLQYLQIYKTNKLVYYSLTTLTQNIMRTTTSKLTSVRTVITPVVLLTTRLAQVTEEAY